MKKSICFGCVLVLGFLLASCKKYEEDPGRSLKRKKVLIEGAWKLKSVSSDGAAQSNPNYTLLEFHTDGFILKVKESPDSAFHLTMETGRWEFKDKMLRMNHYEAGTMNIAKINAWKILRLTASDFFVTIPGTISADFHFSFSAYTAAEIRLEFEKAD